MSRLEVLHEKVKNHPFRLNKAARYANAYYKLITDITDELYVDIKRRKLNSDEIFPFLFMHELNANAWHSCIYVSKEGHIAHEADVVESDVWLSIELGIMAIHEYIRTGRINETKQYYTGNNTTSHKGCRWNRLRWNGKKWIRDFCKDVTFNEVVK